MDKKIGKKEILLLVIIFVAAVIGYFVFQKLQSTPGGQVKVTVDGAVYGTYDLNPTGGKAQKIEIRGQDGTVTNTLVIEDGKADMISADCPDKLCVNQHAISSNGERPSCVCQIKSWWKWKTGKKPSLTPRRNNRTKKKKRETVQKADLWWNLWNKEYRREKQI